MRRGIREMDLILTAYAEAELAGMDDAALDRYEALLQENDQDLYQWITGRAAAPEAHRPLLEAVAQVFQNKR